MTIKKFLHSCILIELNGKRLLIDPGEFSFVENKLKPEDIPKPDVLLLTHEHADHYFPEAIRTIVTPNTKIVTHERIAELLSKENIPSVTLSAGYSLTLETFMIEAFDLPHGALPIPEPKNSGYLINKVILHPGDSLAIPEATCLEILFLPLAAPWLTLREAIETGLRLQPKTIIPIHDAFIKDFMLQRLYSMAEKKFSEAGITFKPLALGEELLLAG